MRVRNKQNKRIYTISDATWNNMSKRNKAVFEVVDNENRKQLEHPSPIKKAKIQLPKELREPAHKGTTEEPPEPPTNKG